LYALTMMIVSLVIVAATLACRHAVQCGGYPAGGLAPDAVNEEEP
jgi:hypothetical protein